ncbi:jg24683 [Pararge aegeria aegeria]|uniref:Jg24683 protein n=1 Tax=Pararge aegeria aegeria TaxID=348720 RepID=A0A8S4QQ37_9NEOP|nr:jg24683 [Pararge aegeria aegeria]
MEEKLLTQYSEQRTHTAKCSGHFGPPHHRAAVYSRIASEIGWTASEKLRNILSSKMPECLKTKVVEECVLPVITYESVARSLSGRCRELCCDWE